MEFIKEVTYVFSDGEVSYEYPVYVDSIEGRRYPSIDAYSRGLNYRGTGTPHQVISAELLSHTGLLPDSTGQGQETRFMFYLPDVDAYVKGTQFWYPNSEGELERNGSMMAFFLDKLIN